MKQAINIRLEKDVIKNLDEYAKEGLRTLLIASKTIGQDEYQSWSKKYQTGDTSMNKEREINKVAEELEVGMGKVGMPLRVATTGSGNSPSLDVTLNLLDQGQVEQRIAKALKYIANRENS